MLQGECFGLCAYHQIAGRQTEALAAYGDMTTSSPSGKRTISALQTVGGYLAICLGLIGGEVAATEFVAGSEVLALLLLPSAVGGVLLALRVIAGIAFGGTAYLYTLGFCGGACAICLFLRWIGTSLMVAAARADTVVVGIGVLAVWLRFQMGASATATRSVPTSGR